MSTKYELSKDQIESLQQDYLYELVNETGFGAPKLWNKNAPRNFQAFIEARLRLSEDLSRAIKILIEE